MGENNPVENFLATFESKSTKKEHKDRIVPLDTHLSNLLQYHTAKIPLDEIVFPLTSVQIRNI